MGCCLQAWTVHRCGTAISRNHVWLGAVERSRLGGRHFHDLRHPGNDLAAGTGATLRELMDRMGHSTARVALIYLHGSDQRQHEIAQALSDPAEAEIERRGKHSTDGL